MSVAEGLEVSDEPAGSEAPGHVLYSLAQLVFNRGWRPVPVAVVAEALVGAVFAAADAAGPVAVGTTETRIQADFMHPLAENFLQVG
jgi:hypothetical protein